MSKRDNRPAYIMMDSSTLYQLYKAALGDFEQVVASTRPTSKGYWIENGGIREEAEADKLFADTPENRACLKSIHAIDEQMETLAIERGKIIKRMELYSPK